MRNQKKQVASSQYICQTQGLPALLSVYNAVINDNMHRIKKHLCGLLETDAVLALVGEVFGLIPLEPDSRHVISVITNTQLFKLDDLMQIPPTRCLATIGRAGKRQLHQLFMSKQFDQ
jgi:hypothetical protein